MTKDVQDLLLEYDSDRSNINVLGYIADSVQAIQKVDVVLSLSKFSESFGRTIAEGFAAMKPSLAYDRGAVSELVIDGKTGFLIPQDDLKTAHKTIVKISENPSILSEMGNNALTHLSNICSKDQLKRGIAHALIMSWIKKRTLDRSLS